MYINNQHARGSKLFHEYVVSSEENCCVWLWKPFVYSSLPRRPHPRPRPRPRPRADFGGGGGTSSSLSDISASRGFCFGLATAGRGVEMSWQRSAVNGRISSYIYRCRLASRPFGWTTGGIVTSSDVFLRARDCCRNRPSINSWRRTVVDPSAKWWNFLMFATLRKNAPRNVVQSNVRTITSPLSVPHNWATFTSDDCSTTVTIS